MRKVLLMAMGIMLMTSSLLFAAGSAEDGDAKPERYALMMSHMTNAFTMELSDAVKSKAKELGVDLTVFDGGQDVSKQISQVESAINQGYAGILIEPASVDGIKPAAEAAKKAGIPLITVNQRITDQELASAYVGANPVEGGELECVPLQKQLGKGSCFPSWTSWFGCTDRQNSRILQCSERVSGNRSRIRTERKLADRRGLKARRELVTDWCGTKGNCGQQRRYGPWSP